MRYKTFLMDGPKLTIEQVSQKCGVGDFAVKKMGTCSLWVPLMPDTSL